MPLTRRSPVPAAGPSMISSSRVQTGTEIEQRSMRILPLLNGPQDVTSAVPTGCGRGHGVLTSRN
jgi:hypothetical protein